MSDAAKRAKYDSLYKSHKTSKSNNKRSGKTDFNVVAEWAEEGRSVGRKYADYTFSDFASDAYINWDTSIFLDNIFDSLGNIIEATGEALGDMLDPD